MYVYCFALIVKEKLKLLTGIFFTFQETYEQLWQIRLLILCGIRVNLLQGKLNFLSYFTHLGEGIGRTSSQYKVNAQIY
jgi:hypothetical protein